MRTCQLLGSEAVDTDGHRLGKVHDLRLESGARPSRDTGEPAFSISALVIGSAGYAHVLGYGRGQMAGPWPLTVFFRRMARRSIVVPWSDVVDIGVDQVTVRARSHEPTAGREKT